MNENAVVVHVYSEKVPTEKKMVNRMEKYVC